MPFAPTAEGVAVAYLRTIKAPNMVATTLPALSSWPVVTSNVRGFVVVDGVVGGSGRDTALRVPVMGVSSWAAVPDSDQPQWGAANSIAEDIVAAIYNEASRPVLVQQGASYDQALIQSMTLLAEPRRLEDPDTGRARFVMDLVIAWTRVPA